MTNKNYNDPLLVEKLRRKFPKGAWVLVESECGPELKERWIGIIKEILFNDYGNTVDIIIKCGKYRNHIMAIFDVDLSGWSEFDGHRSSKIGRISTYYPR